MTFDPTYDPHTPLADDHWVVGISGNRLLLWRDSSHLTIPCGELIRAGFSPIDSLHMGLWRGTPCHAWIFQPDLQLPEDSHWVVAGLRSRLGVVDDEEFMLAGRAQQLAHWREFHRFCGRCGAPTRPELHERVLACLSCGALYYPRIAPCVIGIVVRGQECLLAHNARFPDGLYSALAGFIEPGESAEQALVREIREETGIEVDQLEYMGSQPWPFPSQLMLGFVARYSSGEIVVDGVEITDAQWFTAENLPQVPSAHTISGKLIQHFVQHSQKRNPPCFIPPPL
jgi:NAD+ diphosphatase